MSRMRRSDIRIKKPAIREWVFFTGPFPFLSSMIGDS
jgi:hypothetical protein